METNVQKMEINLHLKQLYQKYLIIVMCSKLFHKKACLWNFSSEMHWWRKTGTVVVLTLERQLV